VEKFIGDAVMAVFGVPVVHEDDALRAVRAAVEMRDALPGLGVRGRIGVMTGEVVSGTLERLATGDAVNVAARLEQAAEPGEVLIGAATLALVSGAVDVEPVEPLELKGKAEPVAAYRLLGVRDVPERRHDARFVGREVELALLGEAWKRVRVERRCELVTVVGDAGVGKSRLVAEALAGMEATIVGGRCLPYGEGITYWPVVEVLKQLAVLPPEEAAAVAIRSLLGETDAPTSVEEIAWAFRKTLEAAATTRPVVVVFDDIQWGEPVFLDLIEHVALLSSGASILLYCIARPDLTERRATWPVLLRLEPLGDNDVDELIAGRIPVEMREKIARAAGGNPLFVEEMLAMAGQAQGEIVIPPTLQALLAARLDQLEPSERSVLERGAIEGEVFHRGAVQALAPEDTQVTPRLAALVRKGMIRPDRPQHAGEDGFRFRHLLIRDTAYDALSKATRAELHQRFAAWLEARGADLVELDEILGYHLEQAVHYQRQLANATNPGLNSRAADHLAAAGRGAYARTDVRSATSLLSRALKLVPIGDARRPMLAVDLAEALTASGLGDPDPLLQEASGDPGAAPYATLARIGWLMGSDPEQAATLAARELPGVFKEFETKIDDRGLARAAYALGDVRSLEAQAQAATEAWEQAAKHARLANATGILNHALAGIANVIIEGPLNAKACQARLTQIEQSSPGLLVEAAVHAGRCGLATLDGEFDNARLHHRACRQLCEDLGLAANAATTGMQQGRVEIAAGNYPEAIAVLSKARDKLGDLGSHAPRSTATAYLARAHQLMGNFDQAEQTALEAEAESAPQDTINFAICRAVRAEIHAERGEPKAAQKLAQSAVEHAFRTDFPVIRGDALLALASALRAAGHDQDSADTVSRSIACYEQKGDRPSIERAQAFTRLRA
jgi:tetratricopeptide (TPR) repeat protein